jgi:hypothetical protein
MEHISFGSVESLHNKVKQANKRFHPEQRFFVKPKLHGTNASIVIKPDGVYAQSRKNTITPDSDNAGFAKFVDSLDIDHINNFNDDAKGIIIYGEWAGEGIQKNDAVTLIDKKAFFVFAIRGIDPLDNGHDTVVTDPVAIEYVLEIFNLSQHPDIYVIPTMAELNISFSGDAQHLEAVENTINSLVAQFEEVDPYINSVFGVEAPGEGVVVYPDPADWDEYKALMFKAKTKAHSVNKSKKAASAKVQVSPDVVDFAERFATTPRFEQGVTELGIDLDMKNMGQFLKWVNEDVIKESKDELEESELDWKQCSKEITNRARVWFMTEAKRIV